MTVKPVNGREGDDKERRQIIHKNVAFFTDNPELEQRVLYFYTFLRLWGRIVDPFLMMDDFRNDNPQDYQQGFPWHPHRGIETITYVLTGNVEHSDSLGNTGTLRDGDVQWMTAGSGIIHQEMLKGNAAGQMHGFQLWANLPRDQKMCTPRYQDVGSDHITSLTDDDGTHIRVIAGDYRGYRGPVDGIDTDPLYLDIALPANTSRRFPFDTRRQGFAYIFEGSASFGNASRVAKIV